VRTLPTTFELLSGGVNLMRQVREVRVEDVLGRDPVRVEIDRVGAYLRGRTVLVTGAGGSIGSELRRQIARVGAKRLVLVKSCAIPAEASPAAWAEAGIVDRSFPKFVRGAMYALDLVHSTQWSRVERALRDAYGDSGARGAS